MRYHQIDRSLTLEEDETQETEILESVFRTTSIFVYKDIHTQLDNLEPPFYRFITVFSRPIVLLPIPLFATKLLLQ